MFCKQCGAQIPDGSPFCTSCGTPVSAPEQSVPNPYAQQTDDTNAQYTQPVQNPYAQQTDDTNAQYTQPVQNPYAQQTDDTNAQYTQSVQNPYAQQTTDTNAQYTQSVQNPYAQQTTDTNAQYTQSVQNPYAQQNFDTNGQPVQYAPVQTAVKAPMSPEKKKKIILFGSIGGGVLILIIIALIVIFSPIGKGANSSCSAVIDTYVSATMRGDVDAYLSIIPPDVVSYNVENNYYGDYSAYKESIEDSIGLSSMFSSSVQVNCEITSEKHCTDSEELMEVTEEYCDRYEASAQITDIAKCRVKTYVTYGNIGTPSTDTNTVYLIKINGNWYSDITGVSSSVGSSKFH